MFLTFICGSGLSISVICDTLEEAQNPAPILELMREKFGSVELIKIHARDEEQGVRLVEIHPLYPRTSEQLQAAAEAAALTTQLKSLAGRLHLASYTVQFELWDAIDQVLDVLYQAKPG